MRINELPVTERPREKAYHYGIETLSNAELLALIIGSGYKDKNVIEIANELMRKGQSIAGILNMNYSELTSVTGIKEACAFRFLAFAVLTKREAMIPKDNYFHGSKDIAIRYSKIIGNNKVESVYVIYINSRNEIVAEKQLYKGSKAHSAISIKEIISTLNEYRCKNFLIIHNHPSGNVYPSEIDRINTVRLNNESKKEKLVLIDHIIVSNNKYYSFMENNII